MPRTQFNLSYEKSDLQVALWCWVDTHSGINITGSARRGKISLLDQLVEDYPLPFLPFTLLSPPPLKKKTLLVKKIQLEKLYTGVLLFYLLTRSFFSLERVLVAHVLVTMTKQQSHHCLSSQYPKQNKILKAWFCHCNCIYIKGFHL